MPRRCAAARTRRSATISPTICCASASRRAMAASSTTTTCCARSSQTLARGCGSQAWVHMVLTDNILKLASYSAQAQEDVWGKDPTAKLSNCVTPTGKGAAGRRRRRLERTASVLQRRRPRRLGAGGRRHRPRRPQAGVLGAGAEERHHHRRRLARDRARRHRQQDVRDRGEIRPRASHPRQEGVGRRQRAGRAALCRAGVPHAARRAVVGELSARSRSASPRAASRPITSTRARGNRAAGRGRRWPARRSSRRPRRPRSRPRCGCIRARCARRWTCWSARSRSPSTGRCTASATWPMPRSFRSRRCRRLFNDAGGRVLYADQEMQRKFRDAHAAAAHHSLTWHSAAEKLRRACAGRGRRGCRMSDAAA